LGTNVREKSGIGLALKLEVLELRSSCDAEGVTLLINVETSQTHSKHTAITFNPEHFGGKLTIKEAIKAKAQIVKIHGAGFRLLGHVIPAPDVCAELGRGGHGELASLPRPRG
jgi:hypothetical protein